MKKTGIDSEYRNLMLEFLPRPIRNAREHKAALAHLERIMIPRPSPAKSLYIELLATLIEKYEEQFWPTPVTSPASMLAHMTESRRLTYATVAKESAVSATTISSVIAGRRTPSIAVAAKLAAYFNSPIEFFLDVAPPRKKMELPPLLKGGDAKTHVAGRKANPAGGMKAGRHRAG